MKFPVREATTAIVRATLRDATGALVQASSLTTLKLTLYDEATGAIVNGRDHQNVLNQNGVTLDEAGNLVWEVTPADTTPRDSAKAYPRHVALFEWTYNAGARADSDELVLEVENVRHVPS